MHFAVKFFKKCAKTFIFDVQSFITDLCDWRKFFTICKINLIDLFFFFCLPLFFSTEWTENKYDIDKVFCNCYINIRLKRAGWDDNMFIFLTYTIAHLKNKSQENFCNVEYMPWRNQKYFQLDLFHDLVSFQTQASRTRWFFSSSNKTWSRSEHPRFLRFP